MKAQHTPGPWVVEPNSQGFPSVIVRDGGKYDGATVAREVCNGDANARLIAAAPELLHVANNVYFLLSNIDWNGRNTEQGQKILSDLRDTITKATGQ